MKAKDIMSGPVITAGPDVSTADLAGLLRKHRISAVPITDEHGVVVGVVSEYDLLEKRGRHAREIMSEKVTTVSEDMDVEEVRELMLRQRIHRVPVVAGRRLIGIVSRSDLVGLLAQEWVCEVCGEQVRALEAPERCDRCGAPAAKFTRQGHAPGD